jgi:hypothetical protein
MPTLETSFSIPQNIINLIQNNDNEAKNRLAHFLDGNKKLSDMFTGHRIFYADTHAEVLHVNVSKDNMNLNQDGTGYFESEFTLYYYFGCDDLNQEIEEHVLTNFQINFHNREIDIITEDIPSRDYSDDEI